MSRWGQRLVGVELPRRRVRGKLRKLRREARARRAEERLWKANMRKLRELAG